MDRPYADVPNTPTGGQYIDYNAAKEDRLGFVWMTYNTAGPDSLFFDAYWRTDRGIPNLGGRFPGRSPCRPGGGPAGHLRARL